MKILFHLFCIFILQLEINICVAEDFEQSKKGLERFDNTNCVSLGGKICLDDSEREVEGFLIKRCWKEKEIFICTGPEVNHCEPLESNRGCNEIKGECFSTSRTGLCKHYEKEFTCGKIIDDTNTYRNSQDNASNNLQDNKNSDLSKANKNSVKTIELIGSEFKVLRDEIDLSGCDQEIKDKYCNLVEEKCIEGPEVRNINGKEVNKTCWKWDRKYSCRTNTFIDECKELKKQDCKEIRRDCIYQDEGRCEHYTVQYECASKVQGRIDCIGTKFCIGGVCDEQVRNVNNNFGKAISYLGVLSQVQKEGEACGCNKETDPDCNVQSIDKNKCALFKGESFKCKRITGEYNCCDYRGVLKPVFGCNKEEKELQLKRQAKVCSYVGAWKGDGLLGNLFVRNRSYCCFGSQIAKIIQEQGRKQLGKTWGDIENPDCSSLSLDEIQRIDFARLNFSEMYEDLKETAGKDFGKSGGKMEDILKSYQDNPEILANRVKDKMKGFYEK